MTELESKPCQLIFECEENELNLELIKLGLFELVCSLKFVSVQMHAGLFNMTTCTISVDLGY